MTAASDLSSSATMQLNAAKGLLSQLDALGPAPLDDAALAAWIHDTSVLHNQANKHTAQAQMLFAQSASTALEEAWQTLKGLSAVTAKAETAIKKEASVTVALVKAAAVLDFGIAVAAAVVAPTPATIILVVNSFSALKTKLG